MANHRMFSLRVANSAKFLQMPEGSQLLYFHMVLRADDDGVVEAYPLTKLLGTAPDNFKVLTAKGFIRQLNEDQVIVITEWLEHNKIRADRKVDSIYLPLIKKTVPELPIITPKPRSDVADNSKRLGGQSTDGLSKVKLSKVKLILRDQVALEGSFNQDAFLQWILKNDKQRHIRLIARFLIERRKRYKTPNFTSKEQVYATIPRYVRAAKKVATFENEQISKAVEKAFEKVGDETTLETVYKYLTK